MYGIVGMNLRNNCKLCSRNDGFIVQLMEEQGEEYDQKIREKRRKRMIQKEDDVIAARREEEERR